MWLLEWNAAVLSLSYSNIASSAAQSSGASHEVDHLLAQLGQQQHWMLPTNTCNFNCTLNR
jgi:hypothetical protein